MRPSERPSGRIVSQFASDPDMAELVDIFITELPDRIASMNAAWNARKVPDLTRLAHQLRGASAGYGFPSIGAAAGALEEGLKQLHDPTTQDSVATLAAEFRDLLDLCRRACKRS